MGAERDSERKNLRLQSFDYSSNRAYFVTVCTQNRQRLLCDIKKGIDGNDAVLIHAPSQAKVSGLTKHHHRVGSDGRSVGATLCGRPGNPHEMIVKWFRELERKFDGAWIDLAVIMPDHVHFIVVIHRSGARAEETSRIPGDHTKLLATSIATYRGLGLALANTIARTTIRFVGADLCVRPETIPFAQTSLKSTIPVRNLTEKPSPWDGRSQATSVSAADG